MLSNVPPPPDSMFTAEFLKQVPPMQLRMGLMQLMKKAGTCTSIKMVSTTSEYSGKAEALSDSGYVYPITISIESTPPHKISGLFISTPVKRTNSLDTVIAQLKAFEGTTSLCIMDLTNNKVVVAKDTANYMPTGSTFKLWILGELARTIGKGEHRWDEVTRLDTNIMSLPSGVLQEWPHGAPVTLHTLASQMISISDNTATDHLLHFLKREKVVAMQSVMGHSKPELNSPFLSTRDLFLLKYTGGGEPARHYETLDERQRYEYLRSFTRVAKLDTVEFVDTPVALKGAEWFARTSDLCRTMQWFYQNRTQTAVAEAIEILGINGGIDIDRKVWTTIGYKGGSEPGVLNMTYLLQHKNGTWYALSCSWLRTDRDVDLTEFAGMLTQLISVLGQ